jgi:hypothetical protein
MAPRPGQKSTVKGVNKLKPSDFAYPKTKEYPINTLGRARSALARANHSGNSGSYQHVARAVRKKWGNKVATVGKKRGTVSSPGYKKSKKRK